MLAKMCSVVRDSFENGFRSQGKHPNEEWMMAVSNKMTRGAVYEETKDEPAKPKEMPKSDQAEMEAAFAKLDGNNDGMLSGKETATCKDCDTNKDGEVTLAEFLARK